MNRKVKALMAVAVIGGVTAAVPAGASAAASPVCDATALQATVLVLPSITGGTANTGSPTCQSANGTALAVPAPLAGVLPIDPTSSVLQAQTTLSTDGQTATSTAGLANLGVGVGNSLPLSQITGPIVQGITGSSTPMPLDLGGLLGPLGPTSTMLSPASIQAGLNQIVSSALKGQLLNVGVLNSIATATCSNGQPQLSGSSQVVGPLSVLGQNIPLNAASTTALSLFDTTKLGTLPTALLSTFVNQAIAAIPVNPAILAPLQAALTNQLAPQIQAGLAPLLTQLQNALNMIAQLKVRPNFQTIDPATGLLTQQALNINLALTPPGMPPVPVLDLSVGQARVGPASIKCAVPAAAQPQLGSPTSQAALQCSNRNLELINVLQHGRHTFIEGAARPSLIGRSIPIFFGPRAKKVATAVVQPDGFFRVNAPLPPAKIRRTNKARYFAMADGQKTLRLKFLRRMIVSRTTVDKAANVVHIRGRVTQPLAKPVAKIIIQRRVTCTSTVDVTSIKPKRNGKFSIDVPTPPNTQVGVYRAKTKVRKNTRNPKRYPTFTLPRFVAL